MQNANKKKVYIFAEFFLFAILLVSFSSAFSGSGFGNSSSPYIITNCTQLQEMNISATSFYRLNNNIECSNTSSWNTNRGFYPIAFNGGNLNGLNYTISNIYLNYTTGIGIGIFSTLTGNISNLNIINARVYGTSAVGILAGYFNSGLIDNCSVNGEVTGYSTTGQIGSVIGRMQGGSIRNSYAQYVNVTNLNATSIGGFVGQSSSSSNITLCGVNYGMINASGVSATGVGGFIGRAEAPISNSYADNISVFGGNGGYVGGFCGNGATVGSKITKSWSSGKVYSTGTYTGGFIGRLADNISNCYARVDVNSTADYVGGFIGYSSIASVINSYSSGLVNYTTATYRGGFAGRGTGGNITNCYYDTNTSRQIDNDGRGTPLTTILMKQQASFQSWDFISIWRIIENQTYPYLNMGLTCFENWINSNTTCGYHCGNWDKFQTTYLDSNNCGTFLGLPVNNGTCFDCNYCTSNFACSSYNSTCSGFTATDYTCIQANDTTSCCQSTNLTSDCVYTGNLSDFNIYYTADILNNATLIVSSYPYVDFNSTYNIQLSVPTNNLSTIDLYLTELDDNISVFNMAFVDGKYQLNLLFNQEGDYPFSINGTNPCSSLTGHLSGILKIRKPFYLNICGYKTKDGTKYENDFAYMSAEITNAKTYYDNTMEQFITPLFFSQSFKTPVFHAPYTDGCSSLKLYENNTEYALRLFDGLLSFQTTYSPPNISKSYGTNIYLGKFYLNGTNSTINAFFSDKDIRPYSWLANWILVILIIGVIIISVFLFFAIPDKPSIALILATIIILGSLVTRAVIWLYWGT